MLHQISCFPIENIEDKDWDRLPSETIFAFRNRSTELPFWDHKDIVKAEVILASLHSIVYGLNIGIKCWQQQLQSSKYHRQVRSNEWGYIMDMFMYTEVVFVVFIFDFLENLSENLQINYQHLFPHSKFMLSFMFWLFKGIDWLLEFHVVNFQVLCTNICCHLYKYVFACLLVQ